MNLAAHRSYSDHIKVVVDEIWTIMMQSGSADLYETQLPDNLAEALKLHGITDECLTVVRKCWTLRSMAGHLRKMHAQAKDRGYEDEFLSAAEDTIRRMRAQHERKEKAVEDAAKIGGELAFREAGDH